MNLHEQARAEADKRRYSLYGTDRPAFEDGYIAGHEAATADDDARITRLVGVVTATTMLGPQDAETVVRALVAHAATRTRVVTTVAELDALPIGSVVLDRHGEAWRKTRTGDWTATALGSTTSSGVPLPARVLYELEASQDLHN